MIGSRLRTAQIALREARARTLAVEVERDQARRDRDAAQAHASHWRREVAALVALEAEGATDSELLAKLRRRVNGVPGSPGAILGAWQQVCRLVDSEQDPPLSPASIVDRVAVLVEQQATRHAAGEVRPTGQVFPSMRGFRLEPELTFGNELGDWQAPRPAEFDPLAHVERNDRPDPTEDGDCLAKRRISSGLAYCTREPGHPGQHIAGAGSYVLDVWPRETPRAAYDLDGDVFPPPGRPAPDDVARWNLGAELDREDDLVDASIMCGFHVDDIPCGGVDGHPGGCWPDRQALARNALVAAGIGPHKAMVAAKVLGDAHLLADRGMTVDGDVLAELIADATPRSMADEDARALAARALDEAVRQGMIVLHGPDLHPREVNDRAADIDDAETVWIRSTGWACGACGGPVGDAPCPGHQPKAHARASTGSAR